MDPLERSSFTIDLGVIRRNAERLRHAAREAELWAVVKAEGYGHGAADASRAALEGGASALCVATLPEALHLRDAVRCGIALYGISPFGTDPAADGLEPALRWESLLALVKRLRPGESTGYGRSFVAEQPTWIGIVPVGYADGFRRDMTGTEVLVGGEPRRVVGTVSMDAFAVELDRELAVGTPVTIVGD